MVIYSKDIPHSVAVCGQVEENLIARKICLLPWQISIKPQKKKSFNIYIYFWLRILSNLRSDIIYLKSVTIYYSWYPRFCIKCKCASVLASSASPVSKLLNPTKPAELQPVPLVLGFKPFFIAIYCQKIPHLANRINLCTGFIGNINNVRDIKIT